MALARDRSTAAALLAVGVAALLVLAGTALLLAARDELPERIAIHWGLSGADGWASFSTVLVLNAVLTAALPLLVLVPTMFMHRSVRPMLAATGAGLAVFVGVIAYGTAWAQSRDPELHPAPWIVGAGLAGLGAGALLYWWARPVWAPDPGERRGPPPGAPMADATSTAPLVWSGRLGRRRRLVIDESGVALSPRSIIGPGPVPLERVRSADVATVRAIRDFGGWGYRLGRDGRRGWITRSGDALVVHRLGEPDLVYTVDGATDAAAVLNTLVTRSLT